MDQRLITFQWRLLDRNPTEEGKRRLKCSDHRSPKRREICVQSILVYDNDRPRGNNVGFFFNVDFQC